LPPAQQECFGTCKVRVSEIWLRKSEGVVAAAGVIETVARVVIVADAQGAVEAADVVAHTAP
jgi:hypothetical protein